MKSIELFSGTGGLALGLYQAGFSHAALFEWDKDSCDNIKYNIANGYPGVRDWSVFQTDVRTVCYDGYMDKIQLVAGGPPCQPFSLGGKHRAYNDARDMFPEAVRAVRETRPQAFIFENVKGLLRKSFNSYFSYILLQLQYPEVVKKEDMTWEEHLALLKRYHTSSHVDDLSYGALPQMLPNHSDALWGNIGLYIRLMYRKIYLFMILTIMKARKYLTLFAQRLQCCQRFTVMSSFFTIMTVFQRERFPIN